MKNTNFSSFFVFVLLFSLFGLSASANAQFGLPKVSGNDKPRAKFADNVVRLGDAFPSLRFYQGAAEFDGILEKVSYKTVGNPSYDDLFKESASLNARMQESKFLLEKYGKAPTEFASNSAKLASEKAENATAEITDFKKLLSNLLESSRSDKNRSKELLSKVAGLKPQDDFSPLDANDVVQAISKAKSNLEEVASETPKLIEELAKVAN